LYAKYGNTKALRSVGYKQCIDFFNGDIKDLEKLENEIAQATRNYAKRQMTFWRNEPLKRNWNINRKISELIRLNNIKNEVCSFDKFNEVYRLDPKYLALLISEQIEDLDIQTSEVCYLSIS
jgi:tRNA A37 N6-isopentenylltransferase MiaA